MVGPPLHSATTAGVAPGPDAGTDRGHADRSNHPCTHEDQADRGTGAIETVVSTRWVRWSPLVGDRPPPQAESARVPTKHSRVAARGTHTALIFADPTAGLTTLTLIVQSRRMNAGMISVENRRTLCVVDSPS
jgi:hypothetical protein